MVVTLADSNMRKNGLCLLLKCWTRRMRRSTATVPSRRKLVYDEVKSVSGCDDKKRVNG